MFISVDCLLQTINTTPKKKKKKKQPWKLNKYKLCSMHICNVKRNTKCIDRNKEIKHKCKCKEIKHIWDE